jgi:hypothetical protein
MDMTQTTATTATCHFCTTGARINGCHWTGTEYVRVDVCDACYDAGRLAKHPRKPRQARQARRQPVINMASDWNMLVALTKGARR